MIFIQQIQPLWTKKSRGGHEATLRSKTPDWVAFPSLDCESGIVIQSVCYPEDNGFSPLEMHFINPARGEIAKLGLGVGFRMTKSVLSVKFYGSFYYVGAPRRRSHEVFSLREGEAGRVSFNGRNGGRCRGWSYVHSVVNIFNLKRMADCRLFDGCFDKEFSSVKDLW